MENKSNFLYRGGWTKIIIFFILGMLGAVYAELKTDTSWSQIATPYLVLGGIYNGALAVFGLLMQSPIKALKLEEPADPDA